MHFALINRGTSSVSLHVDFSHSSHRSTDSLLTLMTRPFLKPFIHQEKYYWGRCISEMYCMPSGEGGSLFLHIQQACLIVNIFFSSQESWTAAVKQWRRRSVSCIQIQKLEKVITDRVEFGKHIPCCQTHCLCQVEAIICHATICSDSDKSWTRGRL